MSTTTARRGKKKTQLPKQQTLTGSRLQFATDDDAPLLSNSQPAFAAAAAAAATTSNAPPRSPAVQLVQKAVSPVVAAATAVSAAVVSLAPIPEDAAVDVGQELPSTPRAVNAAASAQEQAEEDQAEAHEDQPAARAGQPPSLTDAVDADELGGSEQPPQHGRFSFSDAQACSAALMRLRCSKAAALVQGAGGLRLLACVVSAAIVAAVLVAQGSMLQAQTGAIEAQQQHMARQAHALQQLRQQLHDASAQLPSLTHATQATSDSLSQLSEHQAALHTNLAALQSVTTWLNSSISIVNLTSQQGQQAWELLAAVAGTGQAGGGSADAGSPNWLQQAVQHAQEQQAAAQQALLAHQLASALPVIDVALADCGSMIVASTPPILTSALHHHHVHQLQQRGWRHSSALGSMAQRAAASVRQHLAPTGSSTATAATTLDAGRLSALHAALLHRVVLRPASQLLPASACIPFAWSPGAAGPAVIEIQLPQAAHIASVTLHAPAPAGDDTSDASWRATTAPGRVAVLLANSSACGGPSAACSAALDGAGSGARGGLVSKPGVVEVFEWDASLDASSYASGRAVLHVREAGGGAGSVRADRVVVVVRDVVGGRGAAPYGPCLARISVQGRPVDAHAFC